ncbi:MAG TPA: permease [Woeseiaceae bacterium]
MTYSLHDLVGNIGVVLILGSYYWLQAGKTTVEDMSYSLVNGLGALLILVSLYRDFNLSAVIIELVWLAISIYGVWRIWLRRPRAGSQP